MNENIFKGIVATLGTGITYLLGDWDIALIVLISFMSLDYLTGLIRAWIKKEVSSDIGLKGIARKSLIFVVLIISVLLDRLINDGNWIFRTLVCYFYIANEGISILENCCTLGLPIPNKIKDALAQLQEGNKKNMHKEDLLE